MTFFKENKLILKINIIGLSIFLLCNSNIQIVNAINSNNNVINQTTYLNNDLDSLISKLNDYKNSNIIDKDNFLDIKNTATTLLEDINFNKDSITQTKLNYILGVCYFYLFDYEKASTHLIISSQNFSDKVDYTIQLNNYYLLSKINLNNGKYDNSIDYFNKGVELATLKLDYVMLSNLYILRASDLSRDKNNIDSIQLNINNALKVVNDNETPNKGLIYYNAGLLYSNGLDRILLGNELLSEAKTIFENNNNILGEINCRINIAKNHIAFYNFNEGINILSPLLSDNKYESYINDLTYILINLNLLDGYINTSNYSKANVCIENLENTLNTYEGVQRIDSLILTHIYKAKLYSKEKNSQKAYDEINIAFKLFNDNIDSISVFGLNTKLEGFSGDIYFELNDIKKAAKHHNNAIELAKNNKDSINVMVYTQKLAFDNQKLNNYKVSYQLFNEFDSLLETFMLNNNSALVDNFEEHLNSSIYNKKIDYELILLGVILILLILMFIVYIIYLRCKEKYNNTLNISKIKKGKVSNSNIDKITGLYTRDYLDTFISEKWSESISTESNISLIALRVDIDCESNYKNMILTKVTSTLRCNCLRKTDVIVLDNNSFVNKTNSQSYDFLIPLLNIDKDKSIEIGKRINDEINNINYDDIKPNDIKISTYIGIATLIPISNIDYSSLIHRVYGGLFSAINTGPSTINHIDDIVEML